MLENDIRGGCFGGGYVSRGVKGILFCYADFNSADKWDKFDLVY